MRRLTVVQLLPALHSGGVERSTLEVAQALVAAGHRAIVVSAGGRLVSPLLDSGAEHLALDIGRKSLLTLRHVVALRRLFAETGADICMRARGCRPGWAGMRCAVCRGNGARTGSRPCTGSTRRAATAPSWPVASG